MSRQGSDAVPTIHRQLQRYNSLTLHSASYWLALAVVSVLPWESGAVSAVASSLSPTYNHDCVGSKASRHGVTDPPDVPPRLLALLSSNWS